MARTFRLIMSCLCAAVLLTGAAKADGVLSLSIQGASGDGGTFRPGDTMHVSLTVASNGTGSGDIFVGVQLADGTIYWLRPDMTFAPVTEPVPFFDNASVATFGTKPIISYPFESFMEGTHLWGALAVADGGHPLQDVTLASDLKQWTFSNNSTKTSAIVTTVAADWSSSAVSVIDSNMNVTKNVIALKDSNYVVTSHGEAFYLLGRSGIDTVTRIPYVTPTLAAATYQYSAMDAADNGNSPSLDDMIFVSNTKAYLIRMKSSRIWIVNPSATNEAEFHIGDIDLSPFTRQDDSDGSPDPTISALVNGKLYVLLQHTDTTTWTALGPSAIAVINTATDTLIDTDANAANGTTPIALHYWSAIEMTQKDGYLYIAMPADMFGYAANPTGIDRVNTADYSVLSIVNGGTSAGGETYGGTINDVVMTSSTRGYFNTYRYDMSTYSSSVTVQEFTLDYPESGDGAPVVTVTGPVAALSGSTDNNNIAEGPNGTLWVLDKTGDGGIIVYHPETGVADAKVNVGLLPSKITFKK